MKKIAFIFPGQASQYIGMGKDVYENFPKAKEIFSISEDVLGFSFEEKVFNGDEKELQDTLLTQVCVFTVSVAIGEVIKEKELFPHFLAGHSLGEFSALVFSEVIGFKQGLLLVKERASLIKKACTLNPGGMLAVIGLKEDNVFSICNDLKEKNYVVEAVNFNSPSQIIVSGSFDGLSSFEQIAKQKGAKKVIPLRVSGAFHSSLMGVVKDEWRKVVNKCQFNKPSIPIVGNTTATFMDSTEKIRSELIEQIDHPVLWTKTVEMLIENSVEIFVEIGPKKVLTGLIRSIAPQVQCRSVEDKKSIEDIISLLH